LFVTRQRAVEMVEQANRRDYPQSQQTLDEQQLKLLGLISNKDSLAASESVIEGEQILGFYDPKTKRLVVIKDANATRSLLEITLSHELTHALEDQVFGLDSDSDPNDDRAIAHSSMAEGSATKVMTLYAERYVNPGQLLALLAAADEDTHLPK